MSGCTLGPLVDEANTAAAAAYTICEVDPSGLALTPEDLQIVDTGSWCQWQPTYDVPDIGGYLPTIITTVKDKVYEELWAQLQAQITTLQDNAAITYSTKIERVSGDEAVAGQVTASYAQWQSGSSALATSVQTALANQNTALSQQILATEASLDGKLTANSEFYQTSLATVGDTMAASGVLNSVTLADGSKVISGFRSQASSSTGSEFTVFADTFKVLNRTPNGSGGYDYSSAEAPFTVQNGTVYIGEVDTSKPQITLMGEFASAPSTVGVPINTIYKNTTTGDSYRFDGTSWVVWLTKGTNGATGSTGSRGSIHITVSGTFSSGTATSSAFQSATGIYDKVIGDWVTFNSGGGSTDYYRSGNYSDTWVNAALYVNGNMIVTGTIYSDKLAAGTITVDRISSAAFAGSGYAGAIFAPGYASSVLYLRCPTTGSNGIAGLQISNQLSSSYMYPIDISSTSSGGISSVAGKSDTSPSCQFVNSGSGTGIYVASSTYGIKILGGVAPFTGMHEVVYLKNVVMDIGDIVSVVGTIGNSTIIDTLHDIIPTTSSKDRGCFGVLSQKDLRIYDQYPICLSELYVDNQGDDNLADITRRRLLPEYEQLPLEYYCGIVNSIGEGMVSVCEIGGDIVVGDYITSSSVRGKGMRQDDDLLHNYTVAKALGSVTWSSEVVGMNGCFEFGGYKCKMIACTYHCG